MTALVVLGAVAAAWALLAGRLARVQIGAPLVMVVAGLVAGAFTEHQLARELDSHVALRLAEIVLALFLFVDATQMRGGRLLGREPVLALRMLLIALPLSIAAALSCGLLLLPGLSWPVVLAIACAIMPSDFAPTESLVRDPRISGRVRSVLNVESGYNDGIVSPLFLFAIILAGPAFPASTPGEALGAAVPSALKAVLVGAALGLGFGWLFAAAQRRGWMTDASRRAGTVVLPLLTYGVTLAIHGNGFVAAFVCGIAFRYLRSAAAVRQPVTLSRGSDFGLVEELTSLVAMGMWFVFGATAILAIDESGVGVRAVVFCLLALTVLRAAPVLLALLGSRSTWRERTVMSTIGPRGTTSIVFGLLAYNELPSGRLADAALLAMTLTVLGSVLLHGVGAVPFARIVSGEPRRVPQREALRDSPP